MAPNSIPPRISFLGPAQFRLAHSSLLDELYQQAKAARWGVSHDDFGAALYRSAVHRFVVYPSGGYAIEFYLRALHLDDLALACALRQGTDRVWGEFVERYRPAL